MDYLKIYNTLDSTNKEAQRLLAAGDVSNGLTLLAKHQSGGRGQYGRVWLTESGKHLAMSIIHIPVGMNALALPTIGMKVSLAIVRSLKEIDPILAPAIKWPNDIYLGSKKLCGILIENALSGSTVQNSIIGIGMNINESRFPPEVPNATSLLLETGKAYNPEELAIQLRNIILQTLAEPHLTWKSEYDQCLYGINQTHRFTSDMGDFEGNVIGVSLQGHLLIQMPNAETRSFASHELKWKMI